MRDHFDMRLDAQSASYPSQIVAWCEHGICSAARRQSNGLLDARHLAESVRVVAHQANN
jgi:hypothetical protein